MTADRAAIAARHVEHHGNHVGYACGQPGPHCWADNQPWPCDAARLLAEPEPIDAAWAEVTALLPAGWRRSLYSIDGRWMAGAGTQDSRKAMWAEGATEVLALRALAARLAEPDAAPSTDIDSGGTIPQT